LPPVRRTGRQARIAPIREDELLVNLGKARRV